MFSERNISGARKTRFYHATAADDKYAITIAATLSSLFWKSQVWNDGMDTVHAICRGKYNRRALLTL